MGEQHDMRASGAGGTQNEGEDDDAFLSPEETESILSSLEEKDRKMLGISGNDTADDSMADEGAFISPEDIAGIGQNEEERPVERNKPSAGQSGAANSGGQNHNEGLQSDLLTRIAGELRSIKTELGSLKNHYDDIVSREAATSQPESRRPQGNRTDEGPDASGRTIPQETLEDIKKLLSYLDRLLESLPEEKIDEFARSEYFDLYRKIFEYFSLV